MSAPTSGQRPRMARIRLATDTDPLLTIGALWQGPTDPQMRFERGAAIRATRTPDGPATVCIEVRGREVRVEAWGRGAEAVLAVMPGLLGELDDATGFVPRHRLVAELARRMPGMRLVRTERVMESLIPAVISQKVTSFEARRAYRALLVRHGERAPGPFGLFLPPPPEKLARMPYWALHPLGIERRRADALRAAAAVAPRLEELVRLPAPEARRRLQAVPGIGPWTAAETMRLACGDPDAVSVGDYNLPRLVCWALTGEARGDDARMLELLGPYVGQRARAVRLIELSGLRPPRHGPRLAPRSIAAI